MKPRPYHSVSGVKLASRCMYAATLRYHIGLREPGTKSTELGGAFHRLAEDVVRNGASYDPKTPEGRLWQAGSWMVPSKFLSKWCERPIGGTPLPRLERSPTLTFVANDQKWALNTGSYDEAEIIETAESLFREIEVLRCGLSDHHLGNEPTGFEWGGVLWAGSIDLLFIPASDERVRLGLPTPAGEVIGDYKTSSDIKKYALTPETLAEDWQANLYAFARMITTRETQADLYWMYFQTRGAVHPTPVQAQVRLECASQVVKEMVKVAYELDSVDRLDDSLRNFKACPEYGGCGYHKSKGGPCTASIVHVLGDRLRPSVRAKEKTTKKESEKVMGLKERMAAKRAAEQALESAPEPTEPAEAEVSEVAEDREAIVPEEPEAEEEVVEEPPRKAKLIPRAPAKAQAKERPLPELLRELAQELEDAQAALAESEKRVAMALAAISEVVSK